MALSLSRASAVVGDDTQDILEYSPDPALDLRPALSYTRINAALKVFNPLTDRPSTSEMFNKTFAALNAGAVTPGGFFFGDQDFAAVPLPADGLIGKVTNISSSGGATPTITVLTTTPCVRDVRNVLGATSLFYPALFNASFAWLSDWYYPTPTHLLIYNGVGTFAMTSTPPSMTQTYLQCHPLNYSHGSAFGQLGPVGSRLCYSNYYYKMGTTERRYAPNVPWSRDSVVYGAAPDLEVSGYALYSKASGVGSFPTTTIDTDVTKTALDGTSANSALSSTAVPISAAYTIAGVDYQMCILQPTSSTPGTPGADTQVMGYNSVLTPTGGSGYAIDAQGAFFWHKASCYFNVLAFSHGSGDNAYLPGWLFDIT